MLVLTRKVEQKILIDKNITITILKINGDQVSIGIDAPRSVAIVREELTIKKELIDDIIEQNRNSLIENIENINMNEL